MTLTLTLDDDVAAALDREARRSGRPVVELVNDLLRRDLRPADPAVAAPYATRPQSMGLREGLCLDNIQELLSRVEGEASR